MGAKKKYTARQLEKAVDLYFRSISRDKTVTEKQPTGDKDSYGHDILEDMPVLNGLGNPVVITEYLVPPTVGGLASFLGIHRSTWHAWCDAAVYPDYQDVVQDANSRLHAYLEQESLTRPGKDLKGVIFSLENNFGYREKASVQVSGGGAGLEEYLSALAAQGDGQGGSQF